MVSDGNYDIHECAINVDGITKRRTDPGFLLQGKSYPEHMQALSQNQNRVYSNELAPALGETTGPAHCMERE